MKKFGLLIILFTNLTFAQISLTGSGTYNQDFNSLASTGTTNSILPAGWVFLETGTNANTTYAAGIGSDNTGDTYSFGAAANTDRAFGGLLSGSLTTTIGASFVNNTGFTITQIPISYTGEQWRLGALSRVDRLDFQYSLDATSLTTGTWVDIDPLDFTAPTTTGTVGALDGNALANRTAKSSTIMGLNIPNISTFWIRRTDFNATGSDDGLAIDDFSIDQTSLPVELTSFSATTIGSTVKLNWNTTTEVNNYGFDLERKVGSPQSTVGNYEKIGFVSGNGNSNSPKNYSFVDKDVTAGKIQLQTKTN